MREKIDQVAPGLNLTPPWLTRELDKVTTHPVVVPPEVKGYEEKLESCLKIQYN